MSEPTIEVFDLPDTLELGPPIDPHPLLADARRAGPVQRKWPLSVDSQIGGPGAGPSVHVLGYDAALAVFKDSETFSSRLVAEAVGPLLANTMVAMDGETHRVHRALVAHAFRPRLLRRWEDTVVQIAHDLIDGFGRLGRADLVRQFAFGLPVQVITRILGLPARDAPRFQRWSIELISIGTDWQRGMAAFEDLRRYFAAQVEVRRAAPREDDLITELVNVEIDGEELNDEEIFATLRLLLPAGIETTFRSIGNMLFALLTHPDQLAAVSSDAELISPTVEESLRWNGPIVFTGRLATRPTSLAGVEIPERTLVNVFIASANRDEERFDEPDRFDIHRAGHAHIAFGSGPHACLGMHLARLEMRVALAALLERLPDLRLDQGEAAPELRGLPLRSPTSLPVVYDASPPRTGR